MASAVIWRLSSSSATASERSTRVALVGAREMEQRHRRRRLGPPAGLEAMARQQVLDIEGAEAQLHARQTASAAKSCEGVTNSSCAATVRISREPASLVRFSSP
jgi:hypothetical protein